MMAHRFERAVKFSCGKVHGVQGGNVSAKQRHWGRGVREVYAKGGKVSKG